MNFLRLLPVFISFILISAHFMRAGQTIFTVVLLCMLLLLLLRKSWVPGVISVVLVLAALEWLYTLFNIAQMRISFGMPWMRMAIILGAVALFTALSGLVFRSEALRARFSDTRQPEDP